MNKRAAVDVIFCDLRVEKNNHPSMYTKHTLTLMNNNFFLLLFFVLWIFSRFFIFFLSLNQLESLLWTCASYFAFYHTCELESWSSRVHVKHNLMIFLEGKTFTFHCLTYKEELYCLNFLNFLENLAHFSFPWFYIFIYNKQLVIKKCNAIKHCIASKFCNIAI